MFNEVILHRLFLEAFRCSFNFSFALMANLQGTLFSTELAASAKCKQRNGFVGVQVSQMRDEWGEGRSETEARSITICKAKKRKTARIFDWPRKGTASQYAFTYRIASEICRMVLRFHNSSQDRKRKSYGKDWAQGCVKLYFDATQSQASSVFRGGKWWEMKSSPKIRDICR